MAGGVPSETLIVTLSETDKQKLRIAAAMRGVSMRELVRERVEHLPKTSNESNDVR
jgi:hypothetical protein